ncbi:SH3 domain protein [Ancylostoma duodenale]|uniref:SH3 domain protein n=1 Tax=Ancylostoma duodenale TaxID=51022 RepID=A0A0C2GNL5_9BILA|nr:SH3 domain protein [Ancylostoma duodenale]
MPKSDTAFSVSAAKAFFEAAKKPEVRQAAVAAAKNPFVRSVAKSAAQNPETRSQLIAALEKQYAAKSPEHKPSPPSKPRHEDAAPPPPPPPHRGAASMTSSTHSMTSSASSYSSMPSASYGSSSDYSKPLPAAPSTSSSHYQQAPPTGHAPSNGIAYPSLINELQALQMNSPGAKKHPPARPPPVSPTKDSAVSPSQPHAIVKYSFTGSQSDELSCAAGDVVVLKRGVDEQWIYGMNSRTGANGIIPLSFLDIRVPLSSGFSPAGTVATAIYDYQSNTPGDLSFRVNDQITVTERVGPDWLRGTLHGREGIFPANFVSCPGIGGLPMSQPAAQTAPLEKMTAAYDYSSGVSGDLEFKAGFLSSFFVGYQAISVPGDTIEVIAHLDQDWIRGRVNGQEGLAPMSFLAPYGTPVKSPKTRGLAAISALGGTGRVGLLER